MEFDKIPNELLGLTVAETLCISKITPVCSIYTIKKSKNACFKGNLLMFDSEDIYYKEFTNNLMPRKVKELNIMVI